jgi:alkylation response protein AidB-like acyl-CoA dehydrogenase
VSAVAAAEPTRTEQGEIAALACELAARELSPRALALDSRQAGALDGAWRRLGEVGFDRALLAADRGGVGLDAASFLLSLEEIALGDAGVALLVLLANGALAVLPPGRAAEIGRGERWALVPAPPERLATPARISVNGDQRTAALAGSLSPALGALGADGFVVLLPGREPSLYALRSDAPGVEVEPCEPQLGLRSAAAARIALAGATAETCSMPGEPSLALLRAGSAAIARGLARRARQMAFSYAQERLQGGVPIVEHEAVQQMLASMTTRLPAPLPPTAALDPVATLVAKVVATEAALLIATDAVQVFGGTGYMRETGVEKLMRDAKYLQLWPEPNWMADEPIVDATF